MKAEAGKSFQLTPGARVGIVAGGGRLPVEVAQALAAQGNPPFVIMASGEVDSEADFERYEHDTLELENPGKLVPSLKRHGVTHLVLAGNIERRPKLSAMRLNLGLLKVLPSVIVGLARGDDGLLKMLVRVLETRGIKVVGPHQIVPELLAAEGAIAGTEPRKADWRDIDAARKAALAIGALDIGQGAVSVGGRVIALEGIEGTNGMLERVAGLRGHGRLAGKTRGVLVKCAKPDQELRVDLPSIGLQTVEAAHRAGLAGIAIEAGRSLVLEGPQVVARANALGLFVIGLPAMEHAHGQ